jgi:mediator of RNA polymerase II transcription subunit 5
VNSSADILSSFPSNKTNEQLLPTYKVTYTALEWGAADTSNAVALLLAVFRWSSWTPTVYYTQLFLSALSCLAASQHTQQQHTGSPGAKLWKAFIIGRVSCPVSILFVATLTL